MKEKCEIEYSARLIQKWHNHKIQNEGHKQDNPRLKSRESNL